MRTIYPLATLLSLALTACIVADEPKEPEDVWTLDLNVKNLRTITVDVPQQGKKTFHYLRYEIVNNTRHAQTIIPMFELVTQDKQTGHMDAMRTEVFKAIVKREDPDGKLDLKDSVTIAKQALATSKSVQGIAIWEDVDPKATHLSVFVAGLSNGWTADDKKAVRRKMLQLNFNSDGETLKFVVPPQWLYRIENKAVKNQHGSQLTIQRYEQELEGVSCTLIATRRERECVNGQLKRAQMVVAGKLPPKESEDLLKQIVELTGRTEELKVREKETQQRIESIKVLLDDQHKQASR